MEKKAYRLIGGLEFEVPDVIYRKIGGKAV